jgi:flagellar biosynthesis GTPase FlhF
MRIDYLASVAAPILTPLAPATILMSGLYAGMVAAGVDRNIAYIPAVSSGVGMELCGILASAMSFRAIKEKDLAGGALAALGIVGYVLFAMLGMSKIAGAGVFQAFVLMSLVAYFVAAIYQYFEDKKTKRVAMRTEAQENADREAAAEKQRVENEIALMNARSASTVAELSVQEAIEREHTKQANAEARKAKTQKAQENENFPKLSESFHTDWRRLPDEDKAGISAMSTHEIMVKYVVSERTAQNWITYSKGDQQ